MKSIYNQQDNDQIIIRINNLTSESQPLWGKMAVDQMLKHTNEALIVAFGEKSLNINFLMCFFMQNDEKQNLQFRV